MAKLRVERCVEEIDLWICKNLLKLNQDKTELVVIRSKFRDKDQILNMFGLEMGSLLVSRLHVPRSHLGQLLLYGTTCPKDM